LNLTKVKNIGEEINRGVTRIERAISRSKSKERSIDSLKVRKKANFKEIANKKELTNKLCKSNEKVNPLTLSIMSTESSQKKNMEENLNLRDNNICKVIITEGDINIMTEMNERKEILENCRKILLKIFFKNFWNF
jgi:hypothetical protein